MIAKLHAYGFDSNACMLIASYFQDRKQRVKLGNNKSDWLYLHKGAPQGSLFGPFMYNIFSNDLLLTLQNLCHIYNYADDNTISYVGSNVDEVIVNLQNVTALMLKWFECNYLKANSEKFQCILYGKGNIETPIIINNHSVMSQNSVKLLGVNIDSGLSFSAHIAEICKKAGKQLNALGRLSKVLDRDAKLKLFETFILSRFNFCPIIWHFCSNEDMRKIERIQKRSLRFIYNDFKSSYCELRQMSTRPLLYVQRLRYIVLEVFKIYHGLCPKYLCDLIQKRNTSRSTRLINNVEIPRFSSVTYGQNSFRVEGAKLWNSLSDDLKACTNLKMFKRLISAWDGPCCNCSYCKLCILSNGFY